MLHFVFTMKVFDIHVHNTCKENTLQIYIHITKFDKNETHLDRTASFVGLYPASLFIYFHAWLQSD